MTKPAPEIEKKPDVAMIILQVLLLVFLAIYNAYFLSSAWNWFISDYFNLAKLTTVEAYCLLLIVRFILDPIHIELRTLVLDSERMREASAKIFNTKFRRMSTGMQHILTRYSTTTQFFIVAWLVHHYFFR